MKRKSTAPSGRAIYPSRLMPRPRTTFRMDVVVDRNFILSQEKIQERIKASERHNIATEEKTVQQKTNLPPSHPLSLESTRGIKPRNSSRATSPLPQPEPQH